MKGLRYIHILAPCPPGWGFATSKTIKIGKLAVETGVFELYEIINGKFEYTDITKRIAEKKYKLKNTSDYFSVQSRYSRLSLEILNNLQMEINEKFNN